MSDAEVRAAEARSLAMLYDYTKFHIGVYLALTASYITLATATLENVRLIPVNYWFVWPAIAGFLLAGLAGGIIVSSVTQQVRGSSNDFLATVIGPWDWKRARCFTGRTWTHIEHNSFWFGIAMALLSFLCAGAVKAADAPGGPGKPTAGNWQIHSVVNGMSVKDGKPGTRAENTILLDTQTGKTWILWPTKDTPSGYSWIELGQRKEAAKSTK